MLLIRSRRWFLPVIALLMTGYVTALAAGVLTLVVNERSTTRSLAIGLANYTASEWAVEYALLKAKNHLSGFSDAVREEDADYVLLSSGSLVVGASDYRIPRIAYELTAAASSFSGRIVPGQDAFEIIPLFTDTGSVIQINSKDPSSASQRLESTTQFTLTTSTPVVWNIIGRRAGSTLTEGMTGVGANVSETTIGTGRLYNSGSTFSADGSFFFGLDTLVDRSVSVSDFLAAHEENYLIVYNPTASPVDYALTAFPNVSLPRATITAYGITGRFRQILTVSENKSALLDAVKYSLFATE